jgi:transcription antitermination factor NusG
MTADRLQWFALRVRPRAEKIVAQALRAKGFEEFLPLRRHRRAWSDRVVELQVPLFPGYVFSRFDVERRLPLLTTPGVISVVGTARRPDPVEDSEIHALQVLVRSQLQIDPWPYLHIGHKVRVLRGPLAGAEGILTAVRSPRRLVVSVTLLQRSVAVEIGEDSVWPEAPGPVGFMTA